MKTKGTILRWQLSRTGKKREYRAHASYTNGEKAFVSCEGYLRKAACLKNAELFGAPVAELKKAKLGEVIETLVLA